MNVFETLAYYFSFPFVWYALIVGVLIALCAALLGVTLVLKRFSMIGDGLSHVAFGAMAVAMVFSIAPMYIVLPVTILAAIVLLHNSSRAKVRGDAAIGMLSVGAMALGYLLLNVFNVSSNLSGDVCATLFGSTSILTLKMNDVWLSVGLSVVVLAVFVLFYNKLFAVTFDETFARAVGTRTSLYNLIIATVTAVVIVLAMNLVGALLTSALIIFPALSTMRLCKSFRGVILSAACFSVVCAAVGILIAVPAGTPVGPTVVAVDIVAFLLCSGIAAIRERIG